MKTLAIIWAIVVISGAGTVTYINQATKPSNGLQQTVSGAQLQPANYNPQPANGLQVSTYNPQQTINASNLQGGQ